MIKTISTIEVRNIGGALYQAWASQKSDIRLSGRNLHSLLALKKSLEMHLGLIEETISNLALQFGGEQQENGSITIPAESRAAANAALSEYAKETVDVEYTEIVLHEDDVIPMDIYEIILDFVRFEEDFVSAAPAD